MIESQAQRTLVKSPPELWAELSDPAALARYLGELGGEIKITRTEPEWTVVWEGERASGRVELAPSGWGTKVILTLCHEAARAAAATEPGGPGTSAEASAVGAAPMPEAVIAPEVTAAPQAESPAAAPQAETRADDPASASGSIALSCADEEADEPLAAAREVGGRPGFFARLFRRRPRIGAVADTHDADPRSAAPALDAQPQDRVAEPLPATAAPPTPEPVAAPARDAEPKPEAEPPVADAEPLLAGPQPGPEPEPRLANAPANGAPETTGIDPVQATAALTSMLDALGAAHHRPFSRG